MCVYIFFIKEKRQYEIIFLYITLLGHNLFDFYFVHVISYHTLHRFNVTSIINIMPFQVFY